jgi:hypothetical protein
LGSGLEKTKELTITEKEFVKEAFKFLEHPSLLIRISNSFGVPIEASLKKLPKRYSHAITSATRNALEKGVQVISRTLEKKPGQNFRASETEAKLTGLLHTAAGFSIGAVGGFFGLMALPIELPLATGIIFRSILSIANEFEADINDPQVQMECIYILSLGSSKSAADDQMESAYWTSRASFAGLIGEAAKYVSQGGLKAASNKASRDAAPALVRLLSRVAQSFEVNVTEKFLAQAVPVVGALGGGAINAAFTDYFSDAARFHFGLKKLEAKYGQEFVQDQYNQLNEVTKKKLEKA